VDDFGIRSTRHKELDPRKLTGMNNAEQLFQEFGPTVALVKGIHDDYGYW